MKPFRFKLPDWCATPVDPRMLGLYRIVFGLFMVYTFLNYFRIDLVEKMFVEPMINFSYDYLHWLQPMPEIAMHLLLGLLLLCAIAISLGIFFKWSCRVLAIGYAYIFLIDKSIYNNHIYLFILLALLFSMTDADGCYSLKKRSVRQQLIPRWQVLIFQLQIVIVYFYGGLAKLTKDWLLDCQPVRVLVSQFSDENILGPLIKSEFAIYVINYGGLIIDLGAPLFLWYKPVRRWGIILFIGFNALNSRIFSDIGIFPYVMLASLFIFYEVTDIPWLEKLLGGKTKDSDKVRIKFFKGKKISQLKLYGLCAFIIFQLLFPFRGHFLPNDLDYTTIGNRFSWRMKVDTRKLNQMEFFINSPEIESPVPVEVHTFINDVQIKCASMDPRCVADFAKFLKQEAIKYDAQNPMVTANIKIEYNGRAEQYFIDPNVDLSEVSYSPFKKLDWVIPVK